MKTNAVVAHGPQNFRVEEFELPDPELDQVLIDVLYGGICGSDLHYAKVGENGPYRIQEPLVLGHEAVGYVSQIGTAVDDAPPVGTLVAIHPADPVAKAGEPAPKNLHLHQGGTYLGSAASLPHTQGAFREQLAVNPNQLRVVPPGVRPKSAVLAEPLSVAMHGIDRARERIPGARVLVSGSGPIGCLAIAALRTRGAAYISATDIYPFPVEMAKTVGADRAVNIAKTELGPADFDVVVECSGTAQAFLSAIDAVRPGGAIIQLGILPGEKLPTPIFKLLNREITFHGSHRFDNEMEEALNVLSQHPELESIITNVYRLTEAVEAFSTATDSTKSSKVILQIGEER
ncbi:L-idonate 5-dehydrogenase [Brevibacterium sp. FAM 24638]|uniref:L-idonate 5-dehydrogenase n=1 Tax=Brevibacterium sp. FAM 24638 TaxID=3415681 RepID=UPI003C7E7E7B